MYDIDSADLSEKINFLIDSYNTDVQRLSGKISKDDIANKVDYKIKWTRAVKKDLFTGKKYDFVQESIVQAFYRPFTKRYLYFAKNLNEMQYQLPSIFGDGTKQNLLIVINYGEKGFRTLATNLLGSYAR